MAAVSIQNNASMVLQNLYQFKLWSLFALQLIKKNEFYASSKKQMCVEYF